MDNGKILVIAIIIIILFSFFIFSNRVKIDIAKPEECEKKIEGSFCYEGDTCPEGTIKVGSRLNTVCEGLCCLPS